MAGTVLLALGRMAIVQERKVLSATDSGTVEERVEDLERRVSNLERVNRKSVAMAKSGQKQNFYALSGGTVTSGSWTGVPGSEFWLDLALYGNVSQVTWEGWLQNFDGSAVARARLYDITNHRVVDFSEVGQTGKQKASFYSPALAIWRGQNQYRVEVMSTTSNPVTISEARLKITPQ